MIADQLETLKGRWRRRRFLRCLSFFGLCGAMETRQLSWIQQRQVGDYLFPQDICRHVESISRTRLSLFLSLVAVSIDFTGYPLLLLSCVLPLSSFADTIKFGLLTQDPQDPPTIWELSATERQRCLQSLSVH